MRLIEFRAWDTKNKKMIGPFQVGSEKSILRPPEIQFTGRYDTDKAKIFEGDKVELTVMNGILDHCEMGVIATVKWNDEDSGWYFETDYDRYPQCKPWNTKNIKVIGNIHENSQETS